MIYACREGDIVNFPNSPSPYKYLVKKIKGNKIVVENILTHVPIVMRLEPLDQLNLERE